MARKWHLDVTELYGPNRGITSLHQEFEAPEPAAAEFLSQVQRLDEALVLLTERDGSYSRTLAEARINDWPV